MYLYEDYFDTDMRGLPYSAPWEEREDYLKLLDMILEEYLEHKGLHSEDRLYSRGLVITEQELKGYFDRPPILRDRDVHDPLLTESVREAFDHIAERKALSGQEKAGGNDAPLYGIGDIISAFNLNRTELMAVLLAFAGAIDRRYERIFGFLQDDVSVGSPTVGLLYALMGRITKRDEEEDNIPVFLDERMFLFFFLRGEETGLDTPLILNPGMRALLTGQEMSDEKYRDKGLSLYTEDGNIPVFFEESGAKLKKLVEESAFPALFIENPDPDTVCHLLFKSLETVKEGLYVLDMTEFVLLSGDERMHILSDLAIRLKMGLGRLAVRCPSSGEEQKNTIRLIDMLGRLCGKGRIFVFGSDKEPSSLINKGVPAFFVPEPDTFKRTEIWKYFLKPDDGAGQESSISVADLADCHNLSFGMIRAICRHALSEARLYNKDMPDKAALMRSIRRMNNVDFSSLATSVEASYNWEDITLGTEQLEVLHMACNRYRLRNRIGEKWGLKQKSAYGNGVSVLLYGPPGTGKTMAAQVIANELSLPLYRVDISRIFSKYIGETEKNLSVIFNAAAGADVILFFDEADALFSKRTEISGSNDKYSNSETAYLLQKIEEYDGMSILATNYYQNFDNAFVRRITYAVHLESPDEERRYRLWTTILPEETEMEENIDFHFLARQFELSGSNIKAILYSAAYMAGESDKPLGMAHIAKALQYEYRKQRRLIDPATFGPLMVYL